MCVYMYVSMAMETGEIQFGKVHVHFANISPRGRGVGVLNMAWCTKG